MDGGANRAQVPRDRRTKGDDGEEKKKKKRRKPLLRLQMKWDESRGSLPFPNLRRASLPRRHTSTPVPVMTERLKSPLSPVPVPPADQRQSSRRRSLPGIFRSAPSSRDSSSSPIFVPPSGVTSPNKPPPIATRFFSRSRRASGPPTVPPKSHGLISTFPLESYVREPERMGRPRRHSTVEPCQRTYYTGRTLDGGFSHTPTSDGSKINKR